MQNFIQKLRARSETYRKTVAVVTSFVVTLAIAAIWVSINFPGLTSSQAVLAKKSETSGQVTDVKSNLAQTFSAFKNQWSSISDYLSSDTEYDSKAELIVVTPEQKRAEIQGQAEPKFGGWER